MNTSENVIFTGASAKNSNLGAAVVMPNRHNTHDPINLIERPFLVLFHVDPI
jgi:hypothetical protein